MKSWEAKIPQTPRQRDRKRCYTIWTQIVNRARAGGKIVWLTDKSVTFYKIKYPRMIFNEILERDKLEEYKKYMDQTID